ncbi:hypothetical protein KUCAC02_004060 [Chaenocephalus aceratus]|uniref:Uncharacterized protein n=1 Tax=Chaenocephalus aceratus TaxID=36190 RepID=A0ACB9WYE5_CHAAC|nr:hypothetical protein KUCAC02_004060 [Chaenocephalus aceratus]
MRIFSAVLLLVHALVVSRGVTEYGQQVDEEDYEDYYDEEEYEDGMSGDYDELPRVAMKYKDFCIHGTCQYYRNIRAPSCVCHQSYSGERCLLLLLRFHKRGAYDVENEEKVKLGQRCGNSTSK